MNSPIWPPGTISETMRSFGATEIFCGIEDLFRRRDVVGGAGKEVSRTGDVPQIELAAETDELAFGEAVLLEQLGNHLKVPTSGQVQSDFHTSY